MKSKKIIIGTRGSKLALIYAERAKAELKNLLKETDIEIKKNNNKRRFNSRCKTFRNRWQRIIL